MAMTYVWGKKLYHHYHPCGWAAELSLLVEPVLALPQGYCSPPHAAPQILVLSHLSL